MNKHWLVFVFFILIGSVVYSNDAEDEGFDLNIPERVYNINTYVNNELSTWLSLLERYNKIEDPSAMLGFYGSLYYDSVFLNISKDSETVSGIMDFHFSYSFKINDNFYVPLFVAVMSDSITDIFQMQGGGGITCIGNFGSISALAGYGFSGTFTSKDDDKNSDMTTSGHIYLIPCIKMSQYPVVGILFSALNSYLGFNDEGISAYSLRLISKSFMPGNAFTIDSFDIYHNNQKTEQGVDIYQYGLRFRFHNRDSVFGYVLEGGYRTYSPNHDDYDTYDDTFLAKIGIYAGNNSANIGLYFCFDSVYFPMPKIGLDMKIISGESLFGVAFFGEMGYQGNDKTQLIMGFRFHL